VVLWFGQTFSGRSDSLPTFSHTGDTSTGDSGLSLFPLSGPAPLCVVRPHQDDGDPNNRLRSGQSGQEPESHCSRSTPPPSARCTARARTAGLCWANLGKGPAPRADGLRAQVRLPPRRAYLSFLRVRVVRSLWLLMLVVRALCVGHLVESCKQHVHCISGVIID